MVMDGTGARQASPLLLAALDYARRGWRVFPLNSPTKSGGCTCGAKSCSTGKHPRINAWQREATTNEATIREWWRKWPTANIGIATGARSGIVVLDIDVLPDGSTSGLGDLMRRYGRLPETCSTITGSGGSHLIYQHPGGGRVLGNRTHLDGLPGLDIRADGGYIVAPPSLHPSGARYEWESTTQPAPLPLWLLNLLEKPQQPVAPREPAPTLLGDAEAVTARHWLDKALARAVEGNRNHTGFWLACQLRDAGVGQELAESVMDAYANEVPGGGYTQREALNSCRQAYRQAPREKARKAGAEPIPMHRTEGGTQAVSSAPQRAPTHAEPPMPDAEFEAQAERDRARFHFLSDVEVENLPPPEWLIGGHLIANTLSVVYGEFGSAKSFLTLDWALCIATGTPWQGHTVVQGPVAYIAGEGIGGMGKRIRAWKQQHNWRDGATGLWLLGEAPQLLRAEDVIALQKAIEALPRPPALVVIDTLARSMTGGDENSAQDMGLAVAAAESIRARFGCHVTLVHHKPAGAAKTRGSTALPGAADTLVDVVKDNDLITITCAKQKDAAEFERVTLKLLPLALDDFADETSCALVGTTEKPSLHGRLPKSVEALLAILEEMPQGAAFGALEQPFEDRGISRRSITNAIQTAERMHLIYNDHGYWKIARAN